MQCHNWWSTNSQYILYTNQTVYESARNNYYWQCSHSTDRWVVGLCDYPSICPSVCSCYRWLVGVEFNAPLNTIYVFFYRPPQQCVVGLLLGAMHTGEINRMWHTTAMRSAAKASDVTFPATTEGWTQTCLYILTKQCMQVHKITGQQRSILTS